MTYLQLFVVLSLPITGLCYATLGSIKLPLSRRIGLDEAKVGGLISAFGFMVGPIILLCGALSDTYGRQPVWMTGSVLVVASFLVFARARTYAVAVIATVLLAVGWTAMINVANPVMASAYEDPFTGNNLGDALFGGGAFLCPLLVTFLHKRLGFEKGLSVIAILAVVPFVLAFKQQLGGGDLDGKLAEAFTGFSDLLQDKTIWLLGVTLMCWVAIESGTAGWATTLVKESAPPGEKDETSERIAARTLSAFWLCFMGARLLTAFLIHGAELEKAQLVKATQLVQVAIAALAILSMLGLSMIRSRRLVISIVVFTGFICGPFFPNLIGQLFTHLEVVEMTAYGGRSVGILFAFASIGWTFLPMAMGLVANKKGIRRAFLLPAVGAAVMTVVILLNKIAV